MAAEPASVRLLRRELMRWFDDQHLDDEHLATAIALATSEAVANVVRHAYGADAGRVDIDARMDQEDIMVRVCDRGRGLSSRSRSRNGFGLPVIGQVASGVTVESDHAGTTVSMRFALPQPRRRSRIARGRHAVGIR